MLLGDNTAGFGQSNNQKRIELDLKIHVYPQQTSSWTE